MFNISHASPLTSLSIILFLRFQIPQLLPKWLLSTCTFRSYYPYHSISTYYTYIFVLFNGNPTKEFKPSRCLRQGDLIASFLFLIVAQGLLGLVNQAIWKEVFSRLKIGANNVQVKLLQFMDDHLFLCDSNTQNIRAIIVMLRCFKICYGLRVNFF